MTAVRIIDCFTFYNELNMLEFRLTELDDVVDHFVLVEATKTHAGNDKPLFFEENKHRYTKWLPKIIHVIVRDMPEGDSVDAWVRENHQRRCISRGLARLTLAPQDFLSIADLDEIPNPDLLRKMKSVPHQFSGIHFLEQDMYYYHLECQAQLKWYKPKVLDVKTFEELLRHDAQDVRGYRECPCLEQGGWHFSYFGDETFIKNKIRNFAHQEFNKAEYLDDTKISQQITNCDDLFFRNNDETHGFHRVKVQENAFLPRNYKMLLNIGAPTGST